MTRTRQPRFVSLRWRFMLPLFVVLVGAAMAGAYFLANRVGDGLDRPQVNLLLGSSRAISEQANTIYEQTRTEAERAAYTRGVAEALSKNDAETLQKLLEGQTRLAKLDVLTLVNTSGTEILTLLRTDTSSDATYAVNSGGNLSQMPIVQALLSDSATTTRLNSTNEGYLIYVGTPVSDGDNVVGMVLVGWRLNSILSDLKSSSTADVALYNAEGALLQATLTNDSTLNGLQLAPEVFQQAVALAGAQVPVQTLQLGTTPYQAAYFPFRFGNQTLGVVGTFMPDNVPFVTAIGRQLSGLTLALVAGAAVIGVFVALNGIVISRTERVRRTAEALTSGNAVARTNMKPIDEIGAMGRALDQYANYVQERQDDLRMTLRRQRRETEHLMAVLESLPDGIIVQDANGQVVTMNERAKILLGSQRNARNSPFQDLTSVVTDGLGAALAPGVYALGDPARVDLDGKMVNAQAVAVMNISNVRVGTVIVLKDITLDVRRQRLQERVLKRIEHDVQRPLAETAHNESARQALSAVSKELTRHAVNLQKLVVEMRDLNMPDAQSGREGQRALHLDSLIWTVANEWRQVAAANNLNLEVSIARKGLYVLGDERRLRWAIGNMVDNAVKYTPPGGKLMLEVQAESAGQAQLRVRDNGVGIASEEIGQVFTRFYRGTPATHAGRAIQVPGTGQGLTIAKQIIENHGGQIHIKSKVEVGTAIYFTLPLTAEVSLTLPHLQMDMEGETVRLDSGEMR